MLDNIRINTIYANPVSFKSKSKVVQKLVENPKTSTTLLSGVATLSTSVSMGLNKKKLSDNLNINEVKKDLDTGFSISQLAKKYNM